MRHRLYVFRKATISFKKATRRTRCSFWKRAKRPYISAWEQEYQLRNLNQGDCFGEMSLIDFSPRSASVRAVEDCTALQISAACISQIYEKDLEQFAMIEMNMGREVSRRLRESDAALDPTRMSGGSGPT